MHLIISIFLAASALLFNSAMATTPLSIPEKSNQVSPIAYEELRAVSNGFNRFVGTWPSSFSSEAQRAELYTKWTHALQQAWVLEEKDKDSEKILFLLAELYRQGHNMDVIGAGDRANVVIERCLKSYPNSIDCHFSASYFYLSVGPKFAPKGEASLLRLRSLFAPQVNKDVERGIVFAYLYQGRNEEALKQVEYFLRLDPSAEWAKKFRDAIKNDKGRVVVK